MGIKLEFVPDWVDLNLQRSTHVKFDYRECINNASDVNNYLLSQFDFFLEFYKLDSATPFVNPYVNVGANDYAAIYSLVMSTPQLASMAAMLNGEELTAQAQISAGLAKLDDSRDESILYTMGDNASSYVLEEDSSKTLTGKRCFKRYVSFSFSEDEKIVFINMTNNPDKGSVELNTTDHYSLRVSFIEALMTFLRVKVEPNTHRGDAKYLSRRFSTLSRWYHQLLSEMD